MKQSQIPTTPNLSTRLRQQTEDLFSKGGVFLHNLGVHPDAITIIGLLLTVVAAIFVVQGKFVTAVVILIVSLPLDVLDGAVARAMNRNNPFGGVFDSVMDRYADMILLSAVAYYAAANGMRTELFFALVALVGSTQVSYVRARAGAAGLPTAGGMFSRFERLVVLLLTLLTGWLAIGLIVLALGANITALHRIWSVFRYTQKNNEEGV